MKPSAGGDAAAALAAPAAPQTGSRPLGPWVAVWFASWLAVFGVFLLVIVPAGGGMFGRSWVGGLHFALAAAAAAVVHRRGLAEHLGLAGLGGGPPLALAASLALLAAAYAAAPTAWPATPAAWASAEAHQVGLFRMDATYLACKLPELVFQQVMVFALTRRLLDAGLTDGRLVAAFALVFGAVHLPAVGLKGWVAVPFVVAATCAAGVFPLLIARLRAGLVYSFCVHLVAYVVAGGAVRAAAAH